GNIVLFMECHQIFALYGGDPVWMRRHHAVGMAAEDHFAETLLEQEGRLAPLHDQLLEPVRFLELELVFREARVEEDIGEQLEKPVLIVRESRAAEDGEIISGVSVETAADKGNLPGYLFA